MKKLREITLKRKITRNSKRRKRNNKIYDSSSVEIKKWYNLKIQEQILAAENQNTFLEKENRKYLKNSSETS